jgi:hypothetical protein
MQQANWHQLSPLQIRDWIRKTIPIAGVEYCAKELQALSDKFAEIGLADPTSSILVTAEIAKHSGLKPPKGWDAEHIAMWQRLPYRVAKYVVERRALDVQALRNAQTEAAEIRKKANA